MNQRKQVSLLALIVIAACLLFSYWFGFRAPSKQSLPSATESPHPEKYPDASPDTSTQNLSSRNAPNSLNDTSTPLLNNRISLAEPNIPDLIYLIQTSTQIELQDKAARQLAQFGPEAVPALLELKKSENVTASLFAVILLARIDKSHIEDADLDFLGAAVRSGNQVLAWQAAALGAIGPQAHKTVPDLVQGLNSGDDKIRAYALTAIQGIGRPAMSYLIDDLNHENSYIQCYAAWALVQISVRSAARDALPSLTANLKNPDLNIRKMVMMILEYMGPFAQDAVPAVIISLNDDSKDIRLSSIAVLGQLGPHARPAVPALIELLSDENFNIRFYSIRALGLIGPDARTALPHLKTALHDEDADIRAAAAQALLTIEK